MDLTSSSRLQNQLLQDHFIQIPEYISGQTANSPWKKTKQNQNTHPTPNQPPTPLQSPKQSAYSRNSVISLHVYGLNTMQKMGMIFVLQQGYLLQLV